MQIKSVQCRILADSMHTLRRANQCHSNAAARPRGPAGGGGRRPCAMPRRFAREGEAAARDGGAAARESGRDGEAAARDGEAAAREGGAAAREGEAAARECEAAAWEGEAGAAPHGKAKLYACPGSKCSCLRRRRRSVRQGYNHLYRHPAPPSSHDEYRAGMAGARDREGSTRKRAGGRTFCTEAGLRDEGRRAWAGPHFVCLRALGVGG